MTGDSGSSETTDEHGARAAIITVHGTGDSEPGPEGEKWWQRGSEFSGWLIEELASRGVAADIHPLIWTGANSATAREEASRDLEKLTRQLAKDYDNVHVIGHSHGGNVANEAAVLLNWRGGRAGHKSARARLRSISTVGTPFFQSGVSNAERFGAYGFGLMALVSAALIVFLFASPETFLGFTTGDEWFVDVASIQARDQALGGILRGMGIAGLVASLFLAPIAWRGLMRIRRAGRRRAKAGLFSIWHQEDEAIAFLQRIEDLPVEPFARGSLWRGSRTGGILWGVRAVFALPLLGLITLVADWGLKRFIDSQPVEFPPYGFGPAPLEAVAQQMILFGIAGAPLVFGGIYLLYRAFAFLALELLGRRPLNGMVGGALKGIAFGKDGDHNPGNVSSRSHRFGTEALVLEGDLAATMTVNASDAARRLFDKYRSGAFGVDTDQGDIAREIAEDAMTWDALIHTTYFDHREIAAAIANHAVDRQVSEDVDKTALLPPARRYESETLMRGLMRSIRGWSFGLGGLTVTTAVLLGAVTFLAQFMEPIMNRDHLAHEEGVTAPPVEYLAVLEKGADCDVCPEMVVLPGGAFSMGSPTTEPGRFAIEGPIQRVNIKPFAVAKYEVTLGEYQQFVQQTDYQKEGDCYPFGNNLSWENPGFVQTVRDPVVCISFEDVQAYLDWLNSKVEGSPYRLLNEAEWEYAARAGTSTAYSWGNEADKGCRFANGADLTASRTFNNWTTSNCEDGFVYTAPVGSFAANAFGLHDMHGNAFEWVEDCYRDNLAGQTAAPWSGPAACLRVLRGGSWSNVPQFLRSANRLRNSPTVRVSVNGFRIARTLEP